MFPILRTTALHHTFCVFRPQSIGINNNSAAALLFSPYETFHPLLLLIDSFPLHSRGGSFTKFCVFQMFINSALYIVIHYQPLLYHISIPYPVCQIYKMRTSYLCIIPEKIPVTSYTKNNEAVINIMIILENIVNSSDFFYDV